MAMFSNPSKMYKASDLFTDISAGSVVFLVALPLCLGIALASNAPLFSGILAGIVGGIVVGLISGSSTSVSGPAAGLTAVVAAQIGILGSFEALLTATIIAGILQIMLSVARMGYIALFFPSSVIKGLLTAIGIILILKQIPHLLGNDIDPMGEKTFLQLDNKNTISEIFFSVINIHFGALFVGILSILLMVTWDKIPVIKKSNIPAPLVVVALGVFINLLLKNIGSSWSFQADQLVQVPISDSFSGFLNFLAVPDFNILFDKDVYIAGITIGVVASLETLLNIEAIDKVDPSHRVSPPNRELFAQGCGNLICGFIGGLPVTSVIVRSSVNLNSGVKTKLSTFWHGILLIGCVLLIPGWLNEIPLSALAAILLVTGFKLVSPKLFKQMWNEGYPQFLPFIITVIAIVFTDLLIGSIIGLFVAIGFILNSNMRYPMRKILEKHATGNEVLHVELPNQLSFFNKATLENIFRNLPKGGHILLDARSTDYIDPDILDLIVDFQNNIAPSQNVSVSLKGFKSYTRLEDKIQFVDFSSREIQESLTPSKVLDILKEGNERFRNGTPLDRDLNRLLNNTSKGQFPMAVALSCIDSRTPAEIVFDLGLGDIFSIRIAGNVISRKVIASMEYGCAVAGAKLILVMGHTSCGAIKTAVDLMNSKKSANELTGCSYLDLLVNEIKHSIHNKDCYEQQNGKSFQNEIYSNEVAYRNVIRTIKLISERSPILNQMAQEGKIGIVGGMYDIHTGQVSFFQMKSPEPKDTLRSIFGFLKKADETQQEIGSIL